jgi:hypothetical protein
MVTSVNEVSILRAIHVNALIERKLLATYLKLVVDFVEIVKMKVSL